MSSSQNDRQEKEEKYCVIIATLLLFLGFFLSYFFFSLSTNNVLDFPLFSNLLKNYFRPNDSLISYNNKSGIPTRIIATISVPERDLEKMNTRGIFSVDDIVMTK